MSEESYKIVLHPDEKSTYTYIIPDVVKMSNNLSNDLKEQASKYLWFHSLYSRLMAKRDHISNHLKTLYATTEIHARKEAERIGQKTTEATIKAYVESDPEIQKVKTYLAESEAELTICQSIRDAFAQRKDMLVALGANWRAELNATTPDTIRG